MKSSTMIRRFSGLWLIPAAGLCVLVFHSAALAQQPEAPAARDAAAKDADKAKPETPPPAAVPVDQTQAPQAQPAQPPQPPEPQDLPPEYGPPPGYRGAQPGTPPSYPGYPPPAYEPYGGHDYYYPPPRYYYRRHYAPVRYYPEPLAYRPFFFGFGLGIGGLALFPESGHGTGSDNKSRTGLGYNLHFGFGVSPRWSVVLAGDGAYSYFSGHGVSQTVWSIGPQVFLTRKLYVRAGIGVATKSVDYCDYSDCYDWGSYSDSGIGGTAAIGFEFMQSYHAALGLEAAGSYGHYATVDTLTWSRDQGTIAVNFVLNLF
jgi:hypothetical protein